MLRSVKVIAGSAAFVLAVATPGAAAGGGRPPSAEVDWTTAWATAPAAAVSGAEQGYPGYTIRNVVHTTAGGGKVRITCPTASAPRPC